MSNPPAGWYPDPTGQPNTIRFWNGEKWTNETEIEQEETAAHSDPILQEPAQLPPAQREAARHEPVQQEPVRQEPMRREPARQEPVQRESVRQEPVQRGPVRQEPVQREPDRRESARQEPVRRESVGAETGGPGLRSVQEPVQQPQQESPDEQADPGGWWQPTPTPQLWDLEPTNDATQANGGPRLRAVTPDEPAQDPGPSAAERAQATWGAPEIAPAPPEHWTQREVTEEELAAEDGTAAAEVPADVPAQQAETPAGSWTLKLAPSPSEASETSEAAVEPTDGWSDVSFTEQPRFAPTPKEDVQPGVPSADVSEDPEVQAADAAEVAAQLQPDWGSQAGDQGDQGDQQTSDQPSWGVEASDEEDLQTPDHPAAPLWTMPDADDATQEQPVPVQLWGDQPTQQQPAVQEPEQNQPWGAGQAEQAQGWGAGAGQAEQGEGWVAGQAEQGQGWGAEQGWGSAGNDAPAADNGWAVGDQHAVQESGPWGPQATAETQNGQVGDQQWGGQSWPVQQNGDQQTSNGWGNDPSWGEGQQHSAPVQQNGGQPWGNGQGEQQQWGVQQNAGPQGGVQQGGVQQAWGEQQTQRAWGEDENEAWGGQTDLSTGVGSKKSKGSGGGGGGRSGAKLPLILGGGVALVLLIVLAVVLITGGGDDKKADPNPTGTPTQSTGTPTNQSSTKPGQSKNPKLHEGIGRISSDAISFPRRNPPWSDRKRLVQQLLNSSGQHIVLQESVSGADDWTADIFVGGLGTGSGFNGDPKATAATLSGQLRTSMYGSIPATYRTVANGAVKRTNKSGWFYQQTVTAKSAAVTDRVLTLTVAVFDLGDGTAVAYISGIPNNRPDLKAAESQAYKGINVG
ncbi:DUF2510 domain-containing protein [Kribbella sp. NPDC058693]|uniref:DUF2510 domain-containing protein n=1 Tax=Kribbella sp. NPDC058693 TaxID=3346602 RepID=UPI003656EBA8